MSASDSSESVPTHDHILAAMQYAEDQGYKNDGDLDRDDAEWRRDVFLGELAEQVAAAHLSDLGLSTRLVDEEDQKTDLDVCGVRVDVKMRKLWDRRDPDLIVRAATAPDADAYLLVELDSHEEDGYSANIAGWVANPEVYAYGRSFCPPGSKHDKLLVHRRHLRPVETLADYLHVFRGDGL